MKYSILCVPLLLLSPVSAFAQCYIGPFCPVPCITYEWRPVVCYRPEWREEKVPCVVQRVSYRQVVTPVNTKVCVPQEYQASVRRVCYTPVPRQVERDVPALTMVPMLAWDPCSCCCVVRWCPQITSTRVRCVEYDYVPQERVDNVRCWRWVLEDRVVNQVSCVPVVTQEQVTTVRRYCVMVPYQTYVCVPRCW
ncbi:MAG TPA: hypothetical protein VFE62_28555 [Gemmataceae bacterium]|nr:hypothetical protein [Gemmataceae bacterium]